MPRRVRIDVAYDGTDLDGWQLQPGRRTVQGLLEAALRRIDGERPVRVRGAGRTDAGVHARGQVADAALQTALEDRDVAHALRCMLPRDVRPLAVTTVSGDWNARRRAVSKTYVYRLDRTAAGDPFRSRYALHWTRPIDREVLAKALERLPGRRDWSGFAGAACTVADRVRDLTEARYARHDDHRAAFSFSAGGFLNHMVRNLVGTLLEIAAGRMAPERLTEILECGDRRLAGPTAPAHGLCLERVRCDDDTAAPAGDVPSLV